MTRPYYYRLSISVDLKLEPWVFQQAMRASVQELMLHVSDDASFCIRTHERRPGLLDIDVDLLLPREGTRMKGTITAIKPKVVKVLDGVEHFKGGFGFIKGEDGIDRFFHANGVVGIQTFDQLVEGLPVEFEPYSQPGSGGNSQRARSVCVLDAR